jgi:hypothetical protein
MARCQTAQALQRVLTVSQKRFSLAYRTERSDAAALCQIACSRFGTASGATSASSVIPSKKTSLRAST